ncbi:MAG: hypothetical protein RLZZ241_8 [Bacteroidota bacterium]|jgi:glutamyl-tRNA reductase
MTGIHLVLPVAILFEPVAVFLGIQSMYFCHSFRKGMKQYHISKHPRFLAVGLNYEKADAGLRGLFSLTAENSDLLLTRAHEEGVDGLIVISTCNRTELYGFAEAPQHLIRLLCAFSEGTESQFESVGYVFQNQAAIEHLYRVGAGLDSQILGDFEIIGQLKRAFLFSKEREMTNPFLERLVNSVIQGSKRIKRETGISSGATSVAFTAVQYLLARVPEISNKRILLYGTGKIGRNTCENLVKHTGNPSITLINRTYERAEALGEKFNLLVKPESELYAELEQSDVVIVATGAPVPTVTSDMIPSGKSRWILDLTVPINVAPEVGQTPGTTLVHLDQLSKIADDSLIQRQQYIPHAEQILEAVRGEFNQWLESRRFAPVIQALKAKLQTFKAEELDYQSRKFQSLDPNFADAVSNGIIQKITKHVANHLKEANGGSTDSLEFIKQVFQLESENS